MLQINKIHNMDCFIGMEKIADKSIDLIITDPPYNVLKCKWDVKIDLDKMFEQFNRIIKDSGAIIVTATQPFATKVINANSKYFRYDLIWEKTMSVGFANSKRMPLRKHECILIFYKKLPTYNPQGLIKIEPKLFQRYKNKAFPKDSCYDETSLSKPYIQTHTNYPTSILKFSNNNSKNIHPTQKPLALFEYLINTYSNENDVVLDCFMGSGTTAICCINLNRNYLGFELDNDYYEKLTKRIDGHKRQVNNYTSK